MVGDRLRGWASSPITRSEAPCRARPREGAVAGDGLVFHGLTTPLSVKRMSASSRDHVGPTLTPDLGGERSAVQRRRAEHLMNIGSRQLFGKHPARVSSLANSSDPCSRRGPATRLNFVLVVSAEQRRRPRMSRHRSIALGVSTA